MQEKKRIEGYRLSAQQRRLCETARWWAVYKSVIEVEVDGEVDEARLRQAIEAVVMRHEALRTELRKAAGMKESLQVIREEGEVEWEQGLDGAERMYEEEVRRGGGEERGAAVRVSKGVGSSRVVISVAGMSGDEQTMKNIVEEVFAFYSSDDSINLNDEQMQYADFSEWQNELLETDNGDSAQGKAFWQKFRTSITSQFVLPFESGSNAQTVFRPEYFSIEIDSAIASKMHAIAARLGTTASNIALGCWSVLISRLCGEDHLEIALASPARSYEELQSAIGLYQKWLPISLSASPNTPFNDLLDQIHRAKEDALHWQDYFLWGATQQETQGYPTACYEYIELGSGHSGRGLRWEVINEYVCVDRYKLKLVVIDKRGHLSFHLHFDSNIFQEDNISRIAGCFKSLLMSAIAEPNACLSHLDILSESDKHQILAEFNNTAADYSRDKCVHHLFEEQAARTPGRTALVYEQDKLSYEALNARANQIAHYLRERGVSADTCVAVCLERSVEMIAAVLGILKAGGAYLPLNPEYPATRMTSLIEESKAGIIISQAGLMSKLHKFDGEILYIDKDQSSLDALPRINLDNNIASPNLAYVIYTSGSTGAPKGVAISHESLVNYTEFICERLRLEALSKDSEINFASVSTIAADLGNTAIFPSLVSGGTLHLIGYDVATDGDRFADYMSANSIDVLKIVPSHLNALLVSNRGASLLPRRHLILGGEALSFDLVNRIQDASGTCEVINHYGPTESTIGSLTFAAENAGAHARFCQSVPIGSPISNTAVYILDANLNPVPIGVAGELYIAGRGLARGYLNQPAQTAERFIPNPFSDAQSARMYKTGDRARYLPDGNVEFLGRIDHQVKIRGFRVEMGEIEFILKQHSEIRDCVVIAREDEPGHKRLTGYIVAAHSRINSGDLSDYLKSQLPDYMVPSAFVVLKQLPLTSNGKVDRRALPAPDQAKSETTPAAPRNEAEETLARIWAQVLGLKQAGINDNFFELGGDSILSIQVIARANQAGLRLTPKQIFKHQTIAELAAVAGKSVAAEAEQGLVTGVVPLTPIQQWFFERDLPERSHFNQALMFELRQALDAALLEKAVEHLLIHHDALRLRYSRTDSGWQQINAGLDIAPAFTRIDLSLVEHSAQSAELESHAQRLQASLNIEKGELLRVALFDPGKDKACRLLIIIHHLAVDGVSWRILLEDLLNAYQQLSETGAIKPTQKTISFKQWAERLTTYAGSEAIRQELAYWSAEDRQSVSALPKDNPMGANTEESASTVTRKLDADQTNLLLHEVPRIYNTQINDTLLTALAQAFARWTKEQSLLVDIEGHGREEIDDDIDLSRTVGWFTTHYPVNVRLADRTDSGAALKSVKEQLRAIPNKGIGYGLLRYLARASASIEKLKAMPAAEVSFNYLGQFDQVLSESSPFVAARESFGATRSRKGTRSHLLRINANIANGQLQIAWSYSENIHHRETIERLADDFIDSLQSLINHCMSPEAGGYTASDFPQAQLSQKDLDLLIARINQTARS